MTLTATNNPLTVVMTASKSITAQFTKRPTLALRPCGEPSVAEGFQFLVTGEFGARCDVEKNEDGGGWSPRHALTIVFATTPFRDPGATNAARRL